MTELTKLIYLGFDTTCAPPDNENLLPLSPKCYSIHNLLEPNRNNQINQPPVFNIVFFYRFIVKQIMHSMLRLSFKEVNDEGIWILLTIMSL